MQNGTTVLASQNATATGSGNAASYSPIISTNGRYVLFQSKASDLAPGIISTTIENFFQRDLQSGATLALGTNTANAFLTATMSPDGRYVAHGGLNLPTYVWDLQLLKRIYTNAAFAGNLAISAGGERLAYSTASQVFIIDLVAKTSLLLGTAAAGINSGLQFSGDGRFLAYSTRNAGQTNNINLFDSLNETSSLISRKHGLLEGGNGNSDSPTISSDGRFISYRSAASDIVTNDFNGFPDVFLYDRLSGETKLMSLGKSGNSAANNRSLAPVFSGDAQSLFFQSWASDLSWQDFNQTGDLFGFNLGILGPLSVEFISPGTLTWFTVPAANYQVQFKNNLSDPVWHPLNGNITFIGEKASCADITPASDQRFYRVVAY